MAFIVKALGASTIVSTGTSDLYTVPTAKSALLNNVRLVNGNAAVTSAMNLYVKPSGAIARRIHTKDFTLAAGPALLIEDAVTLGQGDKIQVEIAGGGGTPSLGCMINGLERE